MNEWMNEESVETVVSRKSVSFLFLPLNKLIKKVNAFEVECYWLRKIVKFIAHSMKKQIIHLAFHFYCFKRRYSLVFVLLYFTMVLVCVHVTFLLAVNFCNQFETTLRLVSGYYEHCFVFRYRCQLFWCNKFDRQLNIFLYVCQLRIRITYGRFSIPFKRQTKGALKTTVIIQIMHNYCLGTFFALRHKWSDVNIFYVHYVYQPLSRMQIVWYFYIRAFGTIQVQLSNFIGLFTSSKRFAFHLSV